jgi:hypothetical protein
MNRLGRSLLVGVAVVAFASCSRTSSNEDATADHPATVTKIAGSNEARVTLTDAAAKRIGLETAVVKDAPAGSGAAQRTMPNAAVLYDPNGKTWAYTSQGGGTYVRTAVTVARVVGDEAWLSDGPATGTAVVTLGAAELYGAESTFGED